MGCDFPLYHSVIFSILNCCLFQATGNAKPTHGLVFLALMRTFVRLHFKVSLLSFTPDP